MTAPTTCTHTWKVSHFTVSLTLDMRPGTPAPCNVWRPFQPRYFTPEMEAEYEAGLHTAIAKFRAFSGQARTTQEIPK